MLCFVTHFPDILLWGLIGLGLLWVVLKIALWLVLLVAVLLQYYFVMFVYLFRGKPAEFFRRCKEEPEFLDYNKEKKKFNWW